MGDRKQQDIWDDSQLVRHWDDAFAEYKKYHSIDALENRAKRQKLATSTGSITTEVSVEPADHNGKVAEHEATPNTNTDTIITGDQVELENPLTTVEFTVAATSIGSPQVASEEDITVAPESEPKSKPVEPLTTEPLNMDMGDIVSAQTLQEVDYNTQEAESEPERVYLPDIEIELAPSTSSSQIVPVADSSSEENPPKASSMSSVPNPAALPGLDNLDEPLKNLVMSWYWAGYYHGLYVGKSEKKD